MNGRPQRLQGTDGVRGEVAADNDPRVAGMKPAQAFLTAGLLTPAFVERYCIAFVELLRTAGLVGRGGAIALGYDPRDKDRLIVAAAQRGLRTAGMTVHDIGVVPTPALAAYTVAAAVDGGVMITASHNPADQNGIKLFLPYAGIKLFPREDRVLTGIYYDLEDGNAPAGQVTGGSEDRSQQARDLLVSFFADRFNSWVDSGDFSDIVLVIDAANGATAPFVEEIFEPFAFRHLEIVAAGSGSINDHCGAGILEGHSFINADYTSDAGGDFHTVELIQALFRHGRIHRDEIRRGQVRVAGAAFDGDGDRCYMLEYEPAADRVLVLSGDEIALHQGRMVRALLVDDYNGYASFVTTVESDINVAIAAEETGFLPITTGVGDKWLLWEAYASLLGSFWDVLEEQSDDLDMLAGLEEIRGDFEDAEEPDAVNLITRLQGAEKEAHDQEIEMLEHFLQPGKMLFAVGSEETGHSVTIGRVTVAGKGARIVYIGNGIKSALNYLVASRALRRETAPEQFHQRLHRPFPRGVKQTLPVYYTDKSRLLPGNELRRTLERELPVLAGERLSGKLKVVIQPHDEEPDMLYLAFVEPAAEGEQGSVRAALFLRNSGTEAKTSVYLRAPQELAADLEGLAQHAAVILQRQMKDGNNPYAAAEGAVLRRIADQGPLNLAACADLLTAVNAKRLLVEMAAKEKLVEPQGDKLALTSLGRLVVGA